MGQAIAHRPFNRNEINALLFFPSEPKNLRARGKIAALRLGRAI
jgi:hypothetical protein